MSNESETETARAMIAVLSAEPPAAMVALALQRMHDDPVTARRMAALGCALQGGTIDLSAERRQDEPAAETAVAFEKWLEGHGGGDLEPWILSLHFASLMLAGDAVGDDAVTEAAGWLQHWFARGKTKRPLGGY